MLEINEKNFSKKKKEKQENTLLKDEYNPSLVGTEHSPNH
jgi:hypothetical protein